MDSMLQSYWEEAEDLLQKADECLIRLEQEYSLADINELFRIAHTIKGSSQIVGYDDIGSLMHKLEDMLHGVRSGSVSFDARIVNLCFDGVDVVKQLLLGKKAPDQELAGASLQEAAARQMAVIEDFLTANRREELPVNRPQLTVVSSRLGKQQSGKNLYYVSFYIEEDAPMISPILLMIFKSVEEVGILIYSSIADECLSTPGACDHVRQLSLILNTDLNEADLYGQFNLFYIDSVHITDLSEKNIADGHSTYTPIIRIFRPENSGFIPGFRVFAEMAGEHSAQKILLDASALAIIHEQELKELIDIKRQLAAQGLELGIIAGGEHLRKIVNIFDSIASLERFDLFTTEAEAVIGHPSWRNPVE